MFRFTKMNATDSNVINYASFEIFKTEFKLICICDLSCHAFSHTLATNRVIAG